MGEERGAPSDLQDLVARLEAMATRLRVEQASTVPDDEPYLRSGSAVKGAVKRSVFRFTRPATRRADRLAGDLAQIASELAEQVREIARDLERVRGDIDRLDRAVVSVPRGRGGTGDGAPPTVEDAYYWAYEDRMRGDAASVSSRLRQYERFAVPLRERSMAGGADTAPAAPPLWLDLGCGRGELCELVREWGWRVQGVDSSADAVDVCRSKGIEAVVADVGDYLVTRRDDAPLAVSAIQLIEHVPRGEWIALFRHVHALLAPGGAFLLETINGLNPEAVAAYFLGDVTHSWPGHPETLRLMAEYAGFADVTVEFLNHDDRGNAQDFAIWALKSQGADPR